MRVLLGDTSRRHRPRRLAVAEALALAAEIDDAARLLHGGRVLGVGEGTATLKWPRAGRQAGMPRACDALESVNDRLTNSR